MEVSKLNDIRKSVGMSFEELAKKANLPKSTVEKVLFGIVKHPRIDTLQAIERALGIEEEKTAPEYTEAEMQLFELIKQLTDEETEELSNFVDFILSKRK